jgi:hypothetical protein
MPNGVLFQPSFEVDHELRQPPKLYTPKVGDIYLASEGGWFIRFGHRMAQTGAPNHSGIVFQKPDGTLALLEGGPGGKPYIGVVDLIPQVTWYATHLRVWVRERETPLTPEQSYRLTAFALAADQRRFAVFRMINQAGPFRTKSWWRTPLSHHPYAADFDPENPEPSMRKKYFCSELVTEALVAAGVWDAETSRPTSIYPRELYMGTSRIPYLKKHFHMCEWAPPARWEPYPMAVEPELVLRRPWVDRDTIRQRHP